MLERNIRALDQRREQEEAKAGFQDRLADAVTRATGSMAFVYLHLLLFGGWIVRQYLERVSAFPPFDPSFTILAMAASVEAIFLSTFVLITQNRMAAAAEKRAELDLQISLLAEHEITKLAAMVAAIAERIGIDAGADPEVAEITQDVIPEAVLDEIEEQAKTVTDQNTIPPSSTPRTCVFVRAALAEGEAGAVEGVHDRAFAAHEPDAHLIGRGQGQRSRRTARTVQDIAGSAGRDVFGAPGDVDVVVESCSSPAWRRHRSAR